MAVFVEGQGFLLTDLQAAFYMQMPQSEWPLLLADFDGCIPDADAPVQLASSAS